MCQFAFLIFFISSCIFAGIMLHDSRTLWSGASFLFMMICLAVYLLFTVSQYSEWLAAHDLVIGILIVMFILAIGSVIAFPAVLILIFFVEGIRVIRHEGIKPANLLSLLAMYSISAVLNLFHLRKKRNVDYIVVLGAGIIGSKVTPLLAARIEKGIELLHYNPNAVLIMSGGQDPGEDIPESKAMANYAVDKGVDTEKIIMEQKSVSTLENLRFSRELMNIQKPKIIDVTTAYHVFRALILAKQQEIKCVGFGAKTKWYFTLNAFIREFIGYLRLTWKRHALVIGIVVVVIISFNLGGQKY
ncbi:MAG: DUF218 domain-containing protein [Lachnospiraceae bacterium]|nr:DUF218 domain-containing protein [Lachnospiraceae bacterium]